MRLQAKTVAWAVVLIAAGTGLSWLLYGRIAPGGAPGRGEEERAAVVPVETVEIRNGAIALYRTFSGTLEALAEFSVAPKVGGRVVRMNVDIGDTVARGMVVAELDRDEYVQAVARAEADLAVARANLVAARSALEIATRELERTRTLRKRGVASESQLDTVRANQLAAQARLEIAQAQVAREEASLETARIRLGYTKITADWGGEDDRRVVAERYVEEGDSVSENDPLLSIVELDPIVGVIFVPEKDYARLAPGQTATLTTDAFPGERFEGRIDRISPVFRPATRQARIELAIDNPRHRLKPGMFVRVAVELERDPAAVIVPEQALTTRDNQAGIFVVDENGRTVRWCGVEVGIREGDRVQVLGKGLQGRVVTLGQTMLEDGSAILLPEEGEGGGPGTGGADSE